MQTSTPTFVLRFAPAQISELALAYDYESDAEISKSIAPQVRKQGYLTKKQFLTICNWKTKRSRSRCASNSEDFVQSVTSASFVTQNEKLRIEALTLLSGVAWPTASTILHFCSQDRYPILDFRALWSLSVDVPHVYEFDFWWAYTLFCRQLADKASVSMRTLDQALWQFSKENQPQSVKAVVASEG